MKNQKECLKRLVNEILKDKNFYIYRQGYKDGYKKLPKLNLKYSRMYELGYHIGLNEKKEDEKIKIKSLDNYKN